MFAVVPTALVHRGELRASGLSGTTAHGGLGGEGSGRGRRVFTLQLIAELPGPALAYSQESPKQRTKGKGQGLKSSLSLSSWGHL